LSTAESKTPLYRRGEGVRPQKRLTHFFQDYDVILIELLESDEIK
jgi:hypothetical protein